MNSNPSLLPLRKTYYEKIDIRNCIKAKKSKGSTSFASVKKQLEDIEKP